MKRQTTELMRQTVAIISRILFAMLLVWSWPGQADEPNSMTCDYCNFKIEDKATTDLELYCQFPHTLLTFQKEDSIFAAETEIAVTLFDSLGNFADEIFVDRTIVETEFDRTVQFGNKTLVQFNFDLAPGSYHVHVKLVDRNSGNEFELKNDVVVRPFPEGKLSLSDIEVAASVDPSDEATNFVKNGRKVLANPSHQFEAGSEDVHVYFEIYNLHTLESNGANTFRFEYEVKNSAEEVVLVYYQSYPKPYSSTAIDFAIPTKKLEPDVYSLAVTIIDETTQAKATAVATFNVTRSPLDIDPSDFDKSLALLQLIGTKSDIAEMKTASDVERKALLTQFWRSKDPTPGTPENELMVEFYNRIDYAIAHFSTEHVEGWTTDRGKIFIQHGKPDRISRSMPMTGWIRYETWEYWNKGRTFMFGDRFGFGNYTMVDWIVY